MNKYALEVSVGIFVIAGVIALGYLSVKLGRQEILGGGYVIEARFNNIGGLKTGSPVEIAGVEVGRVEGIRLDDYRALVTMRMDETVDIQEDAIVSVRTKGLIGEKFLQITPGGSEKLVKPGGKMRETESAIDFEKLVSSYIFGDV